MLRLLSLLKPYTWSFLALLVLVFIQVAANLELPDYTAKIVNEGILNQNTDLIIQNGLIMLGISLIGGLGTVGLGYYAARIATGFAMDVRNAVFERVEHFSLSEFNRFSTASLITRTTNDVQQIQMVLVMILRMVVAAPVTGVWAIVKAYQTAPSMSWIMALAIGVMLLIIFALFSVAFPKFQLTQKLVDTLNLVTRENLTGLRVVRAFTNERYEEEKFDGVNAELTGVNLFVNRLMSLMQPMIFFIFNITSVAIVWVGAQAIGTGSLEIGDMLAFMQYAIQTIVAFLMISIVFIMVPRSFVSIQRINEVLQTEPEIKDPQTPRHLPEANQGRVEFQQVSFSYPGASEPVLHDITFTAEPGQTTAFIGSTGSGKSTLINLIPRLYDVTGGRVLVDGVDVREYALEDLYSRIGYVPQRGTLFSGTVASNIGYGAPQATDDEMRAAARVAQASEFIEKLEGQLDAPISQGGSNVSGGQKQRLSIARAIVRQPELYIFDDSFSALDFRTDAQLRQALVAETKEKTVLIVGQRISTIMTADKIVVLESGKVAGIGTHRELLRTCTVYQEIAASQLSEDELKKHLADSTSDDYLVEGETP